MKRLLLFGGTTEGRKLVEALAKSDYHILITVATEYGKELIPKVENLEVKVGRLDYTEIIALIIKEKIDFAIDATHPYAKEVTKNLKAACEATGITYYRLKRDISDLSECICFNTMNEAAEFLEMQKGNVLLTIGSKELEAFSIGRYKERYYVRILPVEASFKKCMELGFAGANIIAMQGPFSMAFNAALLREINAKWLVTKDSGEVGGFMEKHKGAILADVKTIVITRVEENGYTLKELCELL